MKRRRALAGALLAAGAGGLLAAAGGAAPVTVQNPGFESDPAASGTFPVLVPDGWTLHDPGAIHDGNQDAVGVLDPSGTTFFPGGVPEGENAALVFVSGDVGGAEMGLRQLLGATLQADTAYTLEVEVGNIASGTGLPPFDVFGFYDLDGFPGYRIALRAGGEVLASDDDSVSGAPPEGAFASRVVAFTSGATHPQLGQPLEILLVNRNLPGTPDEPGIEVDFDDVRLDASPVPEPAGPALFLAGALGLAGGRARCARRPSAAATPQ